MNPNDWKDCPNAMLDEMERQWKAHDRWEIAALALWFVLGTLWLL